MDLFYGPPLYLFQSTSIDIAFFLAWSFSLICILYTVITHTHTHTHTHAAAAVAAGAAVAGAAAAAAAALEYLPNPSFL